MSTGGYNGPREGTEGTNGHRGGGTQWGAGEYK